MMHDVVKNGKTLPHWLGDFLSFVSTVPPNSEQGSFDRGRRAIPWGAWAGASRAGQTTSLYISVQRADPRGSNASFDRPAERFTHRKPFDSESSGVSGQREEIAGATLKYRTSSRSLLFTTLLIHKAQRVISSNGLDAALSRTPSNAGMEAVSDRGEAQPKELPEP